MRHVIVAVVVVAACVSLHASDASAGGLGIFRPRTTQRSQPPRRVYRSYSVSPGSADVPAGGSSAEAGVVAAQPAPAPAPARPSRSSTPSWKRADSKAMGRFGP